MKRAVGSLVFPLLLLPGCMVGPNYQRPEIAMPTQFVETVEPTISSEDPLCDWWKRLNDPLLDALIAEAVESNYDIRLAIERIGEARAQFRIARSQQAPEFDIDGIATRSRISPNLFPIPSGSAPLFPVYLNFFDLDFDAIWELDFFGKFRRGKRAARYQWEATKEDAQAVLITSLGEVARNYVVIRSLQQQIHILQQKIITDKEELALSQALFVCGLASEIQVETLLARLESDRAMLPTLDSSLKQTIFALALLLGKQPESLIEQFTEAAPVPLCIDQVPIGLPSDLLRRRPDIRAAERRLAGATEMIGTAVADLFPQISLTGNTIAGAPLSGSGYGYQSFDISTLLKGASRFFSVGPAIRWDFIDFGKVRGNIAVQNSVQRQALISYEQIVTNALKEVESALAAYFDEGKRTVLLSEQVASNRRSLQLTTDLYQAGLKSESDLLDARKTLLDAETSLVESQATATNNLITLYKVLGGEWECSYSP